MNQATVYSREGHRGSLKRSSSGSQAASTNGSVFQDRIMVSLTSLLVLAAFFTQTSQSIPKTSYVKFIDAWYLALICEDFLVIVALVCVEVVRLREEAAGSKLMHVAPFDKLRNNFVATSKAAKMNTFLIVLFPLSLVVILVAFSFLSTL